MIRPVLGAVVIARLSCFLLFIVLNFNWLRLTELEHETVAEAGAVT
jgi:hypothetical protein